MHKADTRQLASPKAMQINGFIQCQLLQGRQPVFCRPLVRVVELAVFAFLSPLSPFLLAGGPLQAFVSAPFPDSELELWNHCSTYIDSTVCSLNRWYDKTIGKSHTLRVSIGKILKPRFLFVPVLNNNALRLVIAPKVTRDKSFKPRGCFGSRKLHYSTCLRQTWQVHFYGKQPHPI